MKLLLNLFFNVIESSVTVVAEEKLIRFTLTLFLDQLTAVVFTRWVNSPCSPFRQSTKQGGWASVNGATLIELNQDQRNNRRIYPTTIRLRDFLCSQH